MFPHDLRIGGLSSPDLSFSTTFKWSISLSPNSCKEKIIFLKLTDNNHNEC